MDLPSFHNERVRAWPNHDKGGHAAYAPLSAILTRRFETDRHFSCYHAPAVARRLGYEAIGRIPIAMAALVFDVDGPGHDRSPEWWSSERAKLDRLLCDSPGLVAYTTRGGYRVCGYLPRPFELTDRDATFRWRAFYAAFLEHLSSLYEIHADPNCSEWNRLFRAPRVVRDGRSTTPEYVGDPRSVGVWEIGPRIEEVKPLVKVPTVHQGPRGMGTSMENHEKPVTSSLLYKLFAVRGWIGPKQPHADKLTVRCPFHHEHTKGAEFDGSTVLYPPSGKPGTTNWGWLKCEHTHCAGRGIRELRNFFGQAEINAATLGDLGLLRELVEGRSFVRRSA